ncbi:MAG: hypothetical protein WBJ84_00715 [Bacteroidales bacterium]
MKKTFALLFSFVALIAFLSAGFPSDQSPKTSKSTKVEQTVQKKDAASCCDSKAQTTSAAKADCSGDKAKADCAPAGKTCGGCSSKAKAQSGEELPVPKN